MEIVDIAFALNAIGPGFRMILHQLSDRSNVPLIENVLTLCFSK